MTTEPTVAPHPDPSRQHLTWAALTLLGILLTGLAGLLLIARAQTGSYLHKLPMLMLVLSPIPLSWLCAHITARKEVRFGLFLRLFMAGTAYFTWYGLLNFIQMSWNGHTLNVTFGGLLSVLLAAVPYLLWRVKKGQSE